MITIIKSKHSTMNHGLAASRHGNRSQITHETGSSWSIMDHRLISNTYRLGWSRMGPGPISTYMNHIQVGRKYTDRQTHTQTDNHSFSSGKWESAKMKSIKIQICKANLTKVRCQITAKTIPISVNYSFIIPKVAVKVTGTYFSHKLYLPWPHFNTKTAFHV